ncbi:RNA-directed DNA polymerase [Hibiscus syriacus]|uniref:RNA-directed DNA polymerase n=1 Tax=Hibiscus syriacus TaxID=106335 RepID=A0A6A2WYY7_HIBSY|nr:uncharacterized protein LOC120180023 [Hibiscus syriacus]KAE8666891.1 RNA-directed DNA polymerase [Hibiscus syriacus]
MDGFWNEQFSPNLSDYGEANLPVWNQGLLMYPISVQNHSGLSSGITDKQSNGSTVQASQSPNTSNARVLKKSLSSLSETERYDRKRKSDQASYRQRIKQNKVQMQLDFENLNRENDSLKAENQSLKQDNASMNQTLAKQAAMIDQLRSDLLTLKHDNSKQNVLLETLTQYLADPLRLENAKLKAENASLRKSANLNSNVLQLLAENANLKLENKVLKVQNDALCGKIISDNDKKRAKTVI